MPRSNKNLDTFIFQYRWREGYNKLPFNWKCPFCSNKTEILKSDKNVEYECSGKDCQGKLVFI